MSYTGGILGTIVVATCSWYNQACLYHVKNFKRTLCLINDDQATLQKSDNVITPHLNALLLDKILTQVNACLIMEECSRETLNFGIHDC